MSADYWDELPDDQLHSPLSGIPSHCPVCGDPSDPARDVCGCGRAHCWACGERLDQ